MNRAWFSASHPRQKVYPKKAPRHIADTDRASDLNLWLVRPELSGNMRLFFLDCQSLRSGPLYYFLVVLILLLKPMTIFGSMDTHSLFL